MPLGMILDVTIAAMRWHWRSILVLALLFAGPAALLVAAVNTRVDAAVLDILPGIEDGGVLELPVITTAQAERLMSAVLGSLMAGLVAGAIGSIGAVAVAAALLSGVRRWPVTLRAALATALRRTPSVVAYMLVTSAAIVAIGVAGMATAGLAITALSSGPLTEGGPGVFAALIVLVGMAVAIIALTLRWAVAYPVMVAEGAGWRTAMRRSWELSAESSWRILTILLFGLLVTMLGGAALTQLLAVPLADGLATTLGIDVVLAQAVVSAVVSLLLWPLMPALATILYLDLAARRPAAAKPSGGRV